MFTFSDIKLVNSFQRQVAEGIWTKSVRNHCSQTCVQTIAGLCSTASVKCWFIIQIRTKRSREVVHTSTPSRMSISIIPLPRTTELSLSKRRTECIRSRHHLNKPVLFGLMWVLTLYSCHQEMMSPSLMFSGHHHRSSRKDSRIWQIIISPIVLQQS